MMLKQEEAIESYQKAIQFNPKNDAAYYNLANIYSETKQELDSIEYYKKAIEIYPKKDNAFNNLGIMYRQ